MPKIGRNDPCWCGSGKKFKKCHGGNPAKASNTETVPSSCRTAVGTPARIDQDLAQKIKETVLEALQTGRTSAQALELGRSAIIWAEHLVTLFETENPLPQPLACQVGCHFCCHFPVQVTPPEALLLGQFIRENFSAQEQSELLERAEHNLQLRAGRPKGEPAPIRTELPCPLLVGDKCSAYPVRPLACRAMHALEAGDCERALGSPEASFGRYYAHRQEFILSIAQGLREGCRAADCQGDTLDLAMALTDFFRHPDPLEKWVQGGKVFR